MQKIFLFFITYCLVSCSSGDQERLLINFPISYEIKEVNNLGISTFYYTDSIIYRTDNNFVDTIDSNRSELIDSVLFKEPGGIQNFLFQEVSFIDPDSAKVTFPGSSETATYFELAGIGQINLQIVSPLGFKINPDLDMMLSCITLLSKRNIDTLFEGQFLSELDTLYDRDSTFSFQLEIVDDPQAFVQSCNPLDVQQSLDLFSFENNLVNNDRILVHRTDLLFTKK